MNGLELSRKYFEEYGLPMLEERFPDILPVIAVGLCGSGSECFEYDDETSRDHDFEPGFCVFLPDESVVDRQTAFRLERAYSSLPDEYLGFRRENISPAGGARRGVIRASDFFESRTGTADGRLTPAGFLAIPEHFLAETVNGEIWKDDCGIMTDVRERLLYYPEDARLKRLAGNLFLASQSGQYNYQRCLERGETAAAGIAAAKFALYAASAFHLIRKKYMPYYKWAFRSLRELGLPGDAPRLIEEIASGELNGSPELADAIESVCSEICRFLATDCLSQAETPEKCAYEINGLIRDNSLRNANILFGVS